VIVDLMSGEGWMRCCICFEARSIEELYVDENGDTWDLCGDGDCARQAGL
jgi:hypothetical protein